MLAHFSRFARIHQALAPYRRKLFAEASQRGMPVVRHPWLHYPEEPGVVDLELQFMLGPDFMIAPVLDPGCTEVDIWLPPGSWTDLWTGRVVESSQSQAKHRLAAPSGRPGVLYLSGSQAGEELRARLAEQGDL